MLYIESFSLPSDNREMEFMFGRNRLDSGAYSQNPYPFWIFPNKGLHRIEFAPITIFCGKNGSGKSTLLNVIAESLGIHRSAPYNRAPLFDDYVGLCSCELGELPPESEIVTSDGVFDFLLDRRSVNEGIDRKREELFDEYREIADGSLGWTMKSLDEYDELKRRNEVRRSSMGNYAAKRLGAVENKLSSNGESAFMYFTHKIGENALYLLDEPENSLSPMLQRELAEFLENSARFFGCQLVISTHSPFLLAMKGARIYDLDSTPVSTRRWNELPCVRAYYELFQGRREGFE